LEECSKGQLSSNQQLNKVGRARREPIILQQTATYGGKSTARVNNLAITSHVRKSMVNAIYPATNRHVGRSIARANDLSTTIHVEKSTARASYIATNIHVGESHEKANYKESNQQPLHLWLLPLHWSNI